MKNLTPELIAKARAAKNAEDLLALAKENNLEISKEEAKNYFEQLNANSAVSDDELDAVTGGGLFGLSCPNNDEDDTDPLKHSEGEVTGKCANCGSTNIYIRTVDTSGGKSFICRDCSAIVPSANVKRFV